MWNNNNLKLKPVSNFSLPIFKINHKFYCGLLLFLFLLILKTPAYAEVDINKVNNYIIAVEAVLNKYPDLIQKGENSPEGQELMNIIDTYKLNDDEVLEVLNVLTKEYDVFKIGNMWLGGNREIPRNKDIAMKFTIFLITVGNYQERRWENLSAEEILMNKILPLLSKSKNSAVIRYYLIESDGLFVKIHNRKLPMSDENRAKFCDKYIEMFKDENNSIEIRERTAEAWTMAEGREKETIESIEYLLTKEDLFEKTANSFWFIPLKDSKKFLRKSALNNNNSKHEETIIADKMLNILENSDSYSPKILNGAIDYFTRAASSLDENSKKRVIGILEKKLEKETNPDLKGKYGYIINKSKKVE